MPLHMQRRFDVLGLGFGPSNIALAVAHEEQAGDYNIHFLEAQDSVEWQGGMMLDGADIQHNPLKDLVTPCNPRSRYTFLNYLHEAGRLYDFLNLGTPYAFRREYADYVAFVASHFARRVTYGAYISSVSRSDCGEYWTVTTNKGTYEARALVLGIGRSANIPDVFKSSLGPRVFHLNHYLPRMKALPKDARRIAVVGASQSASEILLDLRARMPDADVFAIHRSFSMRQRDTSPFSEKMYAPEFVDYFYNAGERGRADLSSQLSPTVYGSSDNDVLQKLALAMYEDKINGRERLHMKNNTVVEMTEVSDAGVTLGLRERWTGERETLQADAVILATGFVNVGTGPNREACPPVLSGVYDDLLQKQDGSIDVQRNYQVSKHPNQPIFFNGLCESTHGFADAGSFSLVARRAHEINAQLHEALVQSQAVEPEKAVLFG